MKNITELRILLTYDDAGGGSWFAQGLEIDYGAQGKTIEEALTRFGTGLALTIRENICRGTAESLEQVFMPAPKEIIEEFLNVKLNGLSAD